MDSFRKLRDGVDGGVQAVTTTLTDITTRTLPIALAVAGDAHFFEDTTSYAKVKEYLNATKESEKLKGMKWLLAMISKGKDVSEFFPDVVKNVVVRSIEVKKMVYNYLVHYADFNDSCRELALLSINSFQKDLSGANQLIRGLALRVMTSVRVQDIIQIQLLAVKKCGTDTSPYVRKCAATAVTKVYSMDPEQLPQLIQILEKLLNDQTTMVLGSAVSAFNEICPHNYELLHASYRKICHLLADFDEWSQISCLEVLIRYVRNQFTDPAPGTHTATKLQAKQRSSAAVKGGRGLVSGTKRQTIRRQIVRKAFYSDEEDTIEEEEVEIHQYPSTTHASSSSTGPMAALGSAGISGGVDTDGDMDPDHRLALKSAYPLLRSRNAGVVLAVCALQSTVGSQSDSINQQLARAMVRILRSHREIQYVVLNSISALARERPTIFRPYLTEFFMRSCDPTFNRLLKLDILTSICCNDNVKGILRELEHCAKHSNEQFVCGAIRAIGRVADCEIDVAGNCMDGLMQILCCTKSAAVVGESVVVLRQMIQQGIHQKHTTRVLFQLARLLVQGPSPDDADAGEGSRGLLTPISVPVARASIVWLVGEFQDALGKVIPDLLRILASRFTEEANDTKMQILNFAVKAALKRRDEEVVQVLMTYVLEMARYDVDVDLRDRSRFMTALMGLATSSDDGDADKASAIANEAAVAALAERAKGVLLGEKPPPVTLLGSVDVEGLPNFMLGSLSSLLGYYCHGYRQLEPWAAVQSSSTVRDETGPKSSLASWNSGAGSKGKQDDSSDSDREADNLNSFYSSGLKAKAKGAQSLSDDGEESDDDSESDSDSDSESNDSSSDSSGDTSSSENPVLKGSILASRQRCILNNHGGVESGSSTSSTSTASSEPDDSSSSSSSEDEKSSNRVTASSAGKRGMQHSMQAQQTTSSKPGIRRATTNKMTTSNNSVTYGKPLDVFAGNDIATLTTTVANLDIFDISPSNASLSIPAGAIESTRSDERLLDLSGLPSMRQQSQVQPPSLGKSGNSAQDSPDGDSTLFGLDFNLSSKTSMGYAMQSPMTISAATSSSNSNSIASSSSGSGNTIVHLSTPKQILRAEIGGGLAVSFSFKHGPLSNSLPGAHCGQLIVKNFKDHPIRRIKILFPHEIRRTLFDELPQLAPGQEFTIPVDLILDGFTGRNLKIDVRTDVGAFTGGFLVEAWELLSPLVISKEEFEILRKRLTGFNEGKKSFALTAMGIPSGVGDDIDDAVVAARKLLNMQAIYSDLNQAYLASTLKKGLSNERVLMTISTVTSSAGGARDASRLEVQVNCDDPLVCTSLLDGLKKSWK